MDATAMAEAQAADACHGAFRQRIARAIEALARWGARTGLISGSGWLAPGKRQQYESQTAQKKTCTTRQ